MANLIDLILTTSFVTSEGRLPAVGLNTAAFVSGDADATLNLKLYTDAETVDADVTATDLTAQAAVQIKAILAQGPKVGGVRLIVYDGAGVGTPATGLTAAVTGGILPGWSYAAIVVQSRVDATIASASTWAHTNARGQALVFGQLNTSSILSGTVPAGIAASAGADLTCVCFDPTNANASIEDAVGWILSVDPTASRAGFGIQRPLGLVAYSTELTLAEAALASGRESGQASCWIHGPLYPADSRRVIVQGYTIGRTLAEVEWGVIVLEMQSRAAVAQLVAQRAELQLPLRTTAGDGAAIQSVIDAVFARGASSGFIERGIAANASTGQPSLPDGYVLSVTFSGTTAVVTGWAAYPGDVRRISLSITGVVT